MFGMGVIKIMIKQKDLSTIFLFLQDGLKHPDTMDLRDIGYLNRGSEIVTLFTIPFRKPEDQ